MPPISAAILSRCAAATVAAATLLGAAFLAGHLRAEDATASPWEHDLWRKASPSMRAYLCNYSERPPTWCGGGAELEASPKEEDQPVQGPSVATGWQRWAKIIETKSPAELTRDDAQFLQTRAEQANDPEAMETLGYLYFKGIAVPMDLARSYYWYGRASWPARRVRKGTWISCGGCCSKRPRRGKGGRAVFRGIGPEVLRRHRTAFPKPDNLNKRG